MTVVAERPPREDVFRAHADPFEVRADEDAPLILSGHFAVFNTWTEIRSVWEGHFLERIAPGAFKKTFKEQRDQIRCIFQHGYDPEMGEKPIAAPDVLREDETGAYYEATVLDGVPDLIVSGLRAGQYGASFRFKVMREEWVEDPGASDYNPQGLPERTIKEVMVREFGCVTWGQYPEATSILSEGRALAPMRSLTDEWVIDRLTADPDKLRALIEQRTERAEADQRLVDALKMAADSDDEQRSVFMDEHGEEYAVDEDGTVRELSWDDEDDTTSAREGDNTSAPSDEERREKDTQEPEAPSTDRDKSDDTRPVKDYLADEPPAWFIP